MEIKDAQIAFKLVASFHEDEAFGDLKEVYEQILDECGDGHEPVGFGTLAISKSILKQDKAALTRLLISAIHYHFKLTEIKAACFRASVPRPPRLYFLRPLLLTMITTILAKGALPLREAEMEILLKWGLYHGSNTENEHYPIQGIVKQLDHYAKHQESLNDEIKQLLGYMLTHQSEHLTKSVLTRLSALIDRLPIEPGEVWSDQALSDVKAERAQQRKLWQRLLLHCMNVTGGSPKAKWLKEAGLLLDEIGHEAYSERLSTWLFLIDKKRVKPIDSWPTWEKDPNLFIAEANAELLKGLVWAASLVKSDDLLRAVAFAARDSFKKVPGVGSRTPKLGNACVYTLGQMGQPGLAQLAQLKVRVKMASVQKVIGKSLDKAAEKLGIPAEELEEMAVPAYGLTEVGLLKESLGDFKVELRVDGRKALMTWFKPDGKQQKTVPKQVRENHAEDLKELKQASKDIEQMIPALIDRIEQSYMSQKTWPMDAWRERYLDHPLTGAIGRRLIWQFMRGENKVAAIWSDKESGLVDLRGKSVSWLDGQTQVKLWHPLDELNDRDRIMQWRHYLIDHEVRQPFKQAYREIYILTDAERNTNTYSNRFAAHILKQHQFNALCTARNWRNQLRMMVDMDYQPPTLYLPAWDLRAEYWVEGVGDDFETHATAAGSYLYLSTDQVRFYHSDAALNYTHAFDGQYQTFGADTEENQPLPLTEIPPLVLSEVLRDVDLFVGVASVGNDPTWEDGGPEGRYRNYWESYSFGALNATAKTRKEVLERLIPRLKIADRCHFSERFLIVKGDVRTYRIHLGSGNIQMEPDNEYLCIVPNQAVNKKSEGIFLPFEGDATMSIILSKALMLAEDKKIKDRTILSQIHA